MGCYQITVRMFYSKKVKRMRKADNVKNQFYTNKIAEKSQKY